MQDMIAKQRR